MLMFSCVCVCVDVIGCIRVASVQSEPGQQNLLIQPPLGRKRGLRQVGAKPDLCSWRPSGAQLILRCFSCSCDAPCCPSRRMSRGAGPERGCRRPAGASSPRTNRWVTAHRPSSLCLCVTECVWLFLKKTYPALQITRTKSQILKS